MNRALPLVLPFVAVAACEDDLVTSRAPVVEDVRPAAARAGERLTLLGHGFGVVGPRDGVWIGGEPAVVESWDDGKVLLRIPATATIGFWSLVLRAGPRVSAPWTFEVLE